MSDTVAKSKQAVHRERNKLAEQIRHGQETIARAQPWIERLDDMLAKLDPPGEWVLAHERVSFRPVLVDGALVD